MTSGPRLPARIGRRAALASGIGCLLARPARAVSRPLVLGWRRDAVTDVALPAALAYGLLAQYGIETRLVETDPDGAEIAGLLAARKVDAALGPAVLLVGPLHDGLDARLTAGVSAGGLRLLADRHAGIRRIEDVKHRRVGIVSKGGAAHAFFSILARRKGLDPFREIDWVEIPLDAQGGAMRDHEVDAIALPDPYAFALLGGLGLVEVASALTGVYRTRVSSVLACGGALIRDRPSLAADLTRAILRAANWIGHEPKAAAGFAGRLAPMIDPSSLEAMLRTGAQLAEHPAGDALVDDIAAYADEMRLLGTFPFELHADAFARAVCTDLAHPR